MAPDMPGAARIRREPRNQDQPLFRGWPALDTVLQDTRFAFRMPRRNPASPPWPYSHWRSASARTPPCSASCAVLLKPLPYAKPDQLFNVFQRPQDGIAGWAVISERELRELIASSPDGGLRSTS
jgi:hypothetical protein